MNDSIRLALYAAAEGAMGIYPKSFGGVPRTEWQSGWNAYAMRLTEAQIQVADWYEGLPPDVRDMVGEMLVGGVLSLNVVGGEPVKMSFNTSDLFAWGYSDSEEITGDAMLAEVYAAWKRHPVWGVSAWWALKQRTKPQPPVARKMREAGVWNDECNAACPNAWWKP